MLTSPLLAHASRRARAEFRLSATGKPEAVVAAALALVVIGLALLFVVPWAGIPAAVAGVVLFVLAVLGSGRRTATGRP